MQKCMDGIPSKLLLHIEEVYFKSGQSHVYIVDEFSVEKNQRNIPESTISSNCFTSCKKIMLHGRQRTEIVCTTYFIGQVYNYDKTSENLIAKSRM